MPTTAAALLQLRTHPSTFLRNYYLVIDTAVVGTAGEKDFLFGPIGATGVDNVTFIHSRSPQRRGLGMVEAKQFRLSQRWGLFHFHDEIMVRVWYLPVTRSQDVVDWADLPWLFIPNDGPGTNLMATTMLNGCSIACRNALGGFEIVHVQPTLLTSAQTVQNNLVAQNYDMVFGSPGSYDHNNQDVTIIGVRRQGEWRVYAQFHIRNDQLIREVRRIF